MYARITTFNCNPGKMKDAIAMAEEMKSEIMGIPGLMHWFDTGNGDGSCAVIGIYESREAAEAASATVKEMFGRFAECLDSEPQAQGYEVLLHGSNS